MPKASLSNDMLSTKRLIRVFPRRTNATPDDPLAVIGRGPDMYDEADEVHISVAFEWDIPKAESLAREWERVAPVSVGGPALGDPGAEFEPGRYMKHGYVITSRGCPNTCWFCKAWRNEGRTPRELEVKDGWIVQDSNLLACSREHQERVFAMLRRQPRRAHLMGLEAARLQEWHVELLAGLRPKELWFAYDTPDDHEPLVAAAKILREAGIIRKSSHAASCYVLIGWKKDTFEAAEKRLRETMALGFMPQSMLFNSGADWQEAERTTWKRFHREWSNKVIVGHKMAAA